MALLVRSSWRFAQVGSRLARQTQCLAATQVRSYFSDRLTYNHNQPPTMIEQHFTDEDMAEYPIPNHTMIAEFETDEHKLESGVWPWHKGVRARLPDHFKKHFLERYSTPSKPVHYNPNEDQWVVDEYGERKPVQNIPIPVIYPPECNKGLWGGQGLVRGLRKKTNDPMKQKTPRVWKPSLYNRILYSEILNQYLEITITLRTLDLIDECHGFDHYILSTHEVDLRSRLGMKLKQSMLKKLVEKSFDHKDAAQREEIYAKYEQYLIPEDEIAWLGLTLQEAEQLQIQQEEVERVRNIRPMKEVYAEQLIEELKNRDIADSSTNNWFNKLNPFKNTESK